MNPANTQLQLKRLQKERNGRGFPFLNCWRVSMYVCKREELFLLNFILKLLVRSNASPSMALCIQSVSHKKPRISALQLASARDGNSNLALDWISTHPPSTDTDLQQKCFATLSGGCRLSLWPFSIQTEDIQNTRVLAFLRVGSSRSFQKQTSPVPRLKILLQLWKRLPEQKSQVGKTPSEIFIAVSSLHRSLPCPQEELYLAHEWSLTCQS